MHIESVLWPCVSFIARVAITNPHGKIKLQYQAVLHCHNAQIPVQFDEIRKVVKRPKEENIKELFKWDIAEVKFKCLKGKLGVDLYKNNQSLGLFILREGYQIIACGCVTEIFFDIDSQN